MKIRAMVLSEEPLCRVCREAGTITKDSISVFVDHIKALAEGGKDERSNWQGICRTHHREKTAQESARAQGRAEPRVKPEIGLDGWPIT